MRRNLILIAVVALALAACSGGGDAATYSEIGSGLDGGGGETFYDGDDAVGEPEAPEEDRVVASGAVNLDIAVSSDRKVIRNVSLQLAADDTRDAYERIVAIAEGAGGFVSQAEVGPTDEDQPPYIFVTIRVPSASLTSVLTDVKATAEEVLAESQGAQDVTETFIDLEAQLTNLTLLETELRALLEEVRQQPDADPAKLLQVFTEISNTRGEIERIQGQLNYLEDAVDLATVTIDISPTPAALPIVEEEWAPIETVRDASRDLVAGLQRLVDLGITFVIAVLPMLLLVVGLPVLILFLVYRSWRSRRGDRPTPPVAPPVTE